MPKVTLENAAFGNYGVVSRTENRNYLVQTDWEYPAIASHFGWSPCCGEGATDGTVDCDKCGATASELILSASRFLDDHIGDETELDAHAYGCYMTTPERED